MTMLSPPDLTEGNGRATTVFALEEALKLIPIAPFPRHKPVRVDDLDEAKKRLAMAEKLIHIQEERIRQLENLAQTDELTGLVNRRGLLTSLRREIAASRRDKSATGVLVMIDLDGFKQINDTWGHGTGDAYLKAVAAVLSNEIRLTDVAARLGGDEFALLLTHISERAGAERVAELEKKINAKVMQSEGKSLPLRASFGSAAYGAGDTPESVMNLADLKLYAHKARHTRKAPRQSFGRVKVSAT